MKFSELNLEPSLFSAIEKLGYQDLTPIQEAVLPLVLSGKDVSGLAQTGTGKTAAFLIPLMDRILKKSFTDWRAQNFILILVPTRELAEQVFENIQKLGADCGLRGVSVYGGTSYEKQKEGIRNQVEFVVATPGRLIDLFKENIVDLKQVRAIVFDEADRMFDMGFKDDMKFILQRVPRERQFLVFSATLNFDVLNTAYQFGAEPIEVNISRDQAKAENVKDEIFHVGDEQKSVYLLSLLKKYQPKQAIVFSNFKSSVEKLAAFLTDNGIPAMAISSLLTQAQRNRVIEQFKAENENNILVATDVAARGLDVKGVDMVINIEMPNDAESYVHRIGRTGRAGSEGRAFSLVSDRDVEALQRVEEYLKNKLPVGWMEDSELSRDHKPFPNDNFVNRKPFEKSGKPFRERDKGPRDNRDHRGSRPDRGPRHSNQGPHQARGDNRSEQGRGGPRHDPQARHDQRPRPQGQGPRPNNPQNQQGRPHGSAAGPRPHRPHTPQGAHPKGNGQHKPRHSQNFNKNRRPDQRAHNKPAAAEAGILQKVSGFFKKLLGDSSQAKNPPKRKTE